MTTNDPTTDTDDLESFVDRQQRLIERYRETVEDQTETIAKLRDRLADQQATIERLQGAGQSTSQLTRRSALKAGGLLGLLGLGVGTTSASDPTGQVGTEDRPIETLYAAGLNGPLTGGEELTSLVGDGLTVEEGTLAADVEASALGVILPDVEKLSNGEFTADVSVIWAEDIATENLELSLSVEDEDGQEVYNGTITPSEQLQVEKQTFVFGEDDGTDPIDLDFGEYTATVTADADNARTGDASASFVVGIKTWTQLDTVREDLEASYGLVDDLTPETAGYGGDGEDGVVVDANGDPVGGDGFEPIGSDDEEFTGTFDGNGYTIEGLIIG